MIGATEIYVVASLLGALGIWLMLPSAGTRNRWLGIPPAAVALGMLLAGTPRLGDWLADSVFLVMAVVTVVAAAATVTSRKPVYSALWFGLSLLGTAGLLMFQGAQFIAVATVVVYAGAILVTFLFVLMLAQPEGRASYDRTSWESLVSAVTGAVIVTVLSMTLTGVLTAENGVPLPSVAEEELGDGVLTQAHTARVGAELFGRHLIAVEVAGLLLLAALVGAAAIVGQSRGPLAEEDETEETPDQSTI